MSTVRVRRGASNGAELRVALDRPETMNAWNREMGEELLGVLRGAATDDGVRVVVLTGAGRAFSAGADLRGGFERTPEGVPALGPVLEELYHPIVGTVRGMPKPVVAAVNGPAAGVGCALALACDLVIARESAYLLLAFANVGLAPDGGSSVFVPARAGFGRAAEMALLAERVPAPQALAWGLVNRVAADADFEAEVDALAERLATGPTRSYAATKEQLNAWLFRGLDEQLSLEATLQQRLAGTQDFAEGVRAFGEKRPARFTGA